LDKNRFGEKVEKATVMPCSKGGASFFLLLDGIVWGDEF